MANSETKIPIPARLENVAVGGHVAGADMIIDDTLDKTQDTINSEVAGDISALKEAIGTGGSVATQITDAINALDSTKSQNAGADGLALSVTETDGKITSISGSIASGTYDASGAASTAKTEVIGGATSNGDTLKKLEDRVSPLETAIASGGSVDTRIASAVNALDASVSQTAGNDGLALSVTEVDGKITDVSGSIAANTYDAYGAASAAKTELLGDAATDYNTLGKLEDKIQAEALRATNAEGALDTSKADKSDTVSDVTYDSSTGKLKKTINGTTTDVCNVVTSGFEIQYNSSTGIKTLTPVGGATGAFNDSTGIKAITF